MDLVNPLESPELDGLLQAFDDKISDICGKISLLHIYQSQNREDCLELNNILGKNLLTFECLLKKVHFQEMFNICSTMSQLCLTNKKNHFTLR